MYKRQEKQLLYVNAAGMCMFCCNGKWHLSGRKINYLSFNSVTSAAGLQAPIGEHDWDCLLTSSEHYYQCKSQDTHRRVTASWKRTKVVV
eukprot:COSAG06_NODE_41234_length_393_cov_1.221088_1_plen_89_part_10